MKQNTQPVVIITGDSSGIGQATALHLQSCGYKVYGLSRRELPLSTYTHMKCDVTQRDQLKTVFETIYEIEKRIDVVINNAGMGVSGAIEHSTDPELRQILEVNLIAPIQVAQIAIPYLRESKGKMINIGSIAGPLTIPFQAYYSITKASMMSLTEALAMELKPFAIKVTTVMPGDTKSEFGKNRQLPIVTKDDLYQDRILRSLAKMQKDEEEGAEPIKVAKVIERVIRKKNPPLHVAVDFQYQFLLFLRRFLPTKWVVAIIYSMYGK